MIFFAFVPELEITPILDSDNYAGLLEVARIIALFGTAIVVYRIMLVYSEERRFYYRPLWLLLIILILLSPPGKEPIIKTVSISYYDFVNEVTNDIERSRNLADEYKKFVEDEGKMRQQSKQMEACEYFAENLEDFETCFEEAKEKNPNIFDSISAEVIARSIVENYLRWATRVIAIIILGIIRWGSSFIFMLLLWSAPLMITMNLLPYFNNLLIKWAESILQLTLFRLFLSTTLALGQVGYSEQSNLVNTIGLLLLTSVGSPIVALALSRMTTDALVQSVTSFATSVPQRGAATLGNIASGAAAPAASVVGGVAASVVGGVAGTTIGSTLGSTSLTEKFSSTSNSSKNGNFSLGTEEKSEQSKQIPIQRLDKDL